MRSMQPGQPVGQALGRRLFFRLSVVALPGLIAVILVGVVGLLAFNELGRQNGAVAAGLEASTTAGSLAGKLDNLVANLDQLTIPGNQYNAQIYAAGRNGVLSDTQALRMLDLSFAPATRAVRDQLRRDLQTNVADLDRLNTLNSTDLNARFMLWTGGLRDRVAQSNTTIHTLAGQWATAAQGSAQSAETLFFWGRSGILALILLAVGASVLSTTLFTRNIMRPIGRLRQNMERLANGDLTLPAAARIVRQAGESRDELEALEDVYQRMLMTLRPLILHIQDDARQISSSAAEISASSAQQDRNSKEQAIATTEVTVTVEQLNQTAVQIADAAGSVAAAAEQALTSASRGQEAVRDSIIGMAMIRSRVSDITTRILALSEQSQRISEIINVIDEMAARTHILALNAAVESASAGGEAGSRFGVVASEVKKLAQRSVAATREVRVVIAQVQAATNAAVMATEDGLKETEKGVQMAYQSGDANEDIIQMVERTAQLANAISLATQQQRTASEQVVATMREIALVTRQAATGSQQASRAATDLATITGELRAFAQDFQIESGTDGFPPAGLDEIPTPRISQPAPAGG